MVFFFFGEEPSKTFLHFQNLSRKMCEDLEKHISNHRKTFQDRQVFFFVPRRALLGLTVHSGAFWGSHHGALRRLPELCTTLLDIKEHVVDAFLNLCEASESFFESVDFYILELFQIL